MTRELLRNIVTGWKFIVVLGVVAVSCAIMSAASAITSGVTCYSGVAGDARTFFAQHRTDWEKYVFLDWKQSKFPTNSLDVYFNGGTVAGFFKDVNSHFLILDTIYTKPSGGLKPYEEHTVIPLANIQYVRWREDIPEKPDNAPAESPK